MSANGLAYDVSDAEAPGTAWRASAACRGSDPEVFFIERGQDDRPAKAICAGCPVREACLEYALAGGETFGVWGGRSERERKRMRVARRRAA